MDWGGYRRLVRDLLPALLCHGQDMNPVNALESQERLVHSFEQPRWCFPLVLCTTRQHLQSTHKHWCTSEIVPTQTWTSFSTCALPLPAPSRSPHYDKHPKICDGARATGLMMAADPQLWSGCSHPTSLPILLLTGTPSTGISPPHHGMWSRTGSASRPSSAGSESQRPRSQPASLARCWLPPSLYRMYNSHSPSICCCRHLPVLPFSSLGKIEQGFGTGE